MPLAIQLVISDTFQHPHILVLTSEAVRFFPQTEAPTFLGQIIIWLKL